MGLSLHYKGKLTDLAALPQMTEEVKDVCEALTWRFRRDDDGFAFTPPESKMFHFHFRSNGTLANKSTALKVSLQTACFR